MTKLFAGFYQDNLFGSYMMLIELIDKEDSQMHKITFLLRHYTEYLIFKLLILLLVI